MLKKLLFLTAAIAFAGMTIVSCSSDDKSTDPAPDKVFKVLSPNGGEIYQKGEEVVIKYKNELEGDVEISLYMAEDSIYTINSAETNKDSSFWTVPATLATGTDYRIKIKSLTDSTKFDFSDANFTVAPAGEYIIVKSTNGGDIWLKGQTKHITWVDNISGTVDIFLYKNGISIAELTSMNPEPSDGDYAWVIPSDGTFAEGADYQFLIVSTDNAAIWDKSDQFFCLATNDNTQNIVGSWDVTGSWAKWDTVFDFYTDGTWLNTLYTTEFGTWSMTGNGLKMNFDGITRCFLAIVDGDDMSGSMAQGGSIGTWSAVRMEPEITAPNGGEVWLRGTTQTITWTPVSKGDVTLSLADSTGVVQNIATVADSLGTYDWAVPNTITPNADYKIKIAQVINPVSSDESDNYFCISANETVDIVGEWQVNYFWSKSTMYLNFKNDNTWEIVDNTTFTGVWTLVGNGLLIDPDYSDFVYIGIVTGDKIKGTTQQPPTYTGIWDANRILTVTAPNGGNVYQPADVVPITWTENLSAEYVKIDLYENDVLARTIFSNTINDNDQNWTVPADLTTSTKYKVRITSAVDQDIYDESDNYFTIEALAPAAQEDENFDDGLAQNWTAYDGTWTIADSLYRCEKDSALLASSAYYNVPLTGNYYVEADCRKVSGNFYAGIYLNADHTLIESSDNIWKSMQFMINYGQPGYFYLAYCDGVSNWVSVTYQYSAAINQGLNEWNNLKVIVDNGTNFYHLFINDVYIGSYQDNRLSSGEVGLFQYDNTGRYVSEFDNVKIGPVNKSAMDGIKIKRLNSSKPIKLGAKK